MGFICSCSSHQITKPELKNVPDTLVHEPWKLTYMEQKSLNIEIGKDYPLPIVDNKSSTKLAKDKIWNIKKSENAKILSKMLDENKNISRVYYPGLENHPSHEIAKEQMNDFGAMMSFDLDKSVDVYTFLKSLKLIKPGMSLAGVETTVNFPMKTSHGLMTQEERDIQGIGDKLIRLSAGIESYEDLYEDIEQAINLSKK